jgi:2,6-dihydroxypyridine 3-monooxygenase
MSSVAIVGAGITGPAAALAMASNGHDVTVYERRARNDLWSQGGLGITGKNWDALRELGMREPEHAPRGSLAYRNLHNTDTGEVTSEVDNWTTAFHIVRWGDLHNSLVEAAEDKGARFVFRTAAAHDGFDADVVIHSSGIKYAGHHSEFTYAGYSVYRGATTGDIPTDAAWIVERAVDKSYGLNVGHIGNSAAWMLYLPEKEFTRYTDIITPGSRRYENVFRPALDRVTPEWREVINRTGEIQASPMGDWVMPKLLTWNGADYGDRGVHLDMGDAVVPVRPHTTMGANLGIAEAISYVTTPTLGEWEANARAKRERQVTRGHDLGSKLLGR